jgi:uncharacterized protein DUF5591
MPFLSDYSTAQLEAVILRAEKTGHLRDLVESVIALDPLLADAVYIVDNSVTPRARSDLEKFNFTGWASYGRPEVRAFDARTRTAPMSTATTALFLPCSRRRPYGKSFTHKRIGRTLKSIGLDPGGQDVEQVVLTSLGVIPQSLWADPIVLSYDSGVPDIYRLLRLLRDFLASRRFQRVVDCLEFEPYCDLLRIAHREGLFAELLPVKKTRLRRFYVRGGATSTRLDRQRR